MTNIRCKGNKEIDLLAINPRTGLKFHIESRVGTSPSFSIRLHDTYTKKGRPHKIGIDYFTKEKFNHEFVEAKIKEIFGDVNYKKILVVWAVRHEGLGDIGFRDLVMKQFNIEIWYITEMIRELMENGNIKGSRDDILRTVELIGLYQDAEKQLIEKDRKWTLR